MIPTSLVAELLYCYEWKKINLFSKLSLKQLQNQLLIISVGRFISPIEYSSYYFISANTKYLIQILKRFLPLVKTLLDITTRNTHCNITFLHRLIDNYYLSSIKKFAINKKYLFLINLLTFSEFIYTSKKTEH